MEKREILASLGKFRQVWASLGKLGQGNKLEKWERRGRKNKKRGKKFEWLVRRRN